MVWLSDPTLSVVDEALAATKAATPQPSVAPAPDYGTDWASVDAGMLGAFSPGYMYEDGSFSAGGGDVYGAGLSNPWDYPAQQDQAYFEASYVSPVRDDGYFEDFYGEPMGTTWGAGLVNPEWTDASTWVNRDFANQDAAYFEGAGQPWETGGTFGDRVPPGYESPDVIDMRGADPYAGGAPSSMGGDFLLGDYSGVGMPRGWWDGSDPAVDAAYLGGQQNAFNTAQDTGYFEGPSSGGVLGDWIYQYADWGPQTDRAYFQATLPPENPQDAAQSFLYDPPKIDPNNLDMGDWGWLGPAARTLDKYVLQPLDFVSEVGADWTPNLLRTHPLTMFQANVMDAAARGVNAIGGSLPTLDTPWGSAEKTAADLTDYEGAVSDFRDRPMWQQLLAGTVYDPTAFIPGLGASDEVTDALRGLRGNVDDLFQSARPYADDLLRTVDDELGAVQIGRTTPLKAGDIVRDAAGQEFTVAKKFDGTINGWVSVVDDTAESGVKKIKRGMLDAGPVDTVLDDAAAISPTPAVTDDVAATIERARLAEASPEHNPFFQGGVDLRTIPDERVRAALESLPPADQKVIQSVTAYATEDEAMQALSKQGVRGASGHGFGGHIVASGADAPEMAVHEVGHAIFQGLPENMQQRWVTEVSPWKNVHEMIKQVPEERWPVTGYGTASPAEDFAETYRIWRRGDLNPTNPQVRALSPERQAFMRDMDAWLGGKNVPTPIRPPAAAGAPPPAPPTATGPIDLDGARNKLVDALRREANIRRVGTADREISAGRSLQAAGIRDRLAEGRAMGLKGGELADYARGGMKTGPLRKTVAPALDLSPAEKEALIQEVLDKFEGGDFDVMTAAKSVQKMINGEGAQPREIRMLRDFYGDEVADIVASRPRVSPVVEARREAAEMARNNAVAERQYQKALREAEEAAQRANRLAAQTQETADRGVIRQRWKAVARQNDAEEIRQMLANPFLTAEERDIARKQVTIEAGRAQRAAGRATDDIWESARKANPDAETLRRKALEVINERAPSPELAAQAERSVALWMDGNRAVLDAIGETGHQRWRQIEASLSGNVSDSFTSALLRREEDLRAALKAQGLDEDVAKAVARTLQERELALRYKGKLPDAVQRALQEAKALDYGELQGITASVGNISQYLKNSMFWADFSVAGQQVLKAIITNGPAGLAGLANRAAAAMNLPHIVTNMAEAEGVSKRVAYQLDGVMQGARTGAVDLDRTGSAFSRVPGVGRFSEWLTDVQFGNVLTGVRNSIYEGNLIMAKLAGQDITDPKVRAAAAEWANLATSAGGRAQDVRRAQWEKALLLSPQFTRAQVKQIVKLADVIRPGVSMTDRILASTTIVSTAAIGLGVGKFLNDRYGIGDFEMDPSKPGFGRITFPGGRVVDIFPQDQLVTAIARSARELAALDKAGLQDAQDTWTKFVLGRISPPLQMAAKAGGYGFDPRNGGWNLGNYSGDLADVLPIPPSVLQFWREGLDPVGTPLTALGVTNYQESASAKLGRLGYWDMTAEERKAARATNPEIAAAFDEYTKGKSEQAHENVSADDLRTIDFERRNAEVNRIEGERTVNQQVALTQYQEKLAAATTEAERMKLGAEFRDTIADIQNNAAIEKRGVDNAFRLFKDSGELPADPKERAKVEYYNLFDIAGMKGPDGKLDGEAFAAAYEKLAGGWTPEQRAFVETEVRGQKYNIPEVQQMYADQRAIAESGYFDLTEGKRQFRQENPEIAALIRKWGYSPTSIAAEDLTNRTASEQAVDDKALQAQSITPEEWRENYRERMNNLRAAKDVLYAGLKEDGESTKPLDQWFAQIDAAVQPNGIDVDWDRVDAWVASQPADVQKAIDGYTGTALTPLVAEYRADVKRIEASGYWDVRDTVFDYWIQSMGMASGAVKEDQYFDLVRQKYTEYAVDYLDKIRPGWRQTEPQAAAVLAQTALNSLEAKFQTGVTKANAQFRSDNPEVAWLLRKWGYGGTGKEEVFKALGQEAP